MDIIGLSFGVGGDIIRLKRSLSTGGGGVPVDSPPQSCHFVYTRLKTGCFMMPDSDLDILSLNLVF